MERVRVMVVRGFRHPSPACPSTPAVRYMDFLLANNFTRRCAREIGVT